MNETKNQLIQTRFTLDKLHQDGKIDDEAYRILKNRNERAINYSQSCTELKDKKVINFDLWCKIKNIHHSFDDFYLWDTTLIEKESVLKMYQTFIQNL